MRYLVSEENAIATVEQAVAVGINHLETARGYGKSESYLGAALSGLSKDRSQLYITTKIPPVADPSLMARYIDESLVRLQVDYLDALAIHGVNTWDHLQLVQSESGCMQAVAQAIAEGKVRAVGFSSHGPLEVILGAINTDRFDFVNLHYYYFFQRHAQAIALAHQKDLGIFIISPGDKGGRLYTPPQTLTDLCTPFTPLELTYRFLLNDARISTLSVGASNPEELAIPVSISDRDYPLTPEEKEVFQRLEHHATVTLGTTKCSQCYACLPCPAAINIPEVLRLRNLAIGYDMTDYGKYRYGMFENAGHWFAGAKASRCTECGDCLPRCPEELNIPLLLKDTDQRLAGKSGRRLWD